MRKLLPTLALGVGLAFGGADAAEAQQAGLINVEISNIDVETGDILSNNTIQVSVGAALAIAANVCNVAVNVLAVDLGQDGTATCTSTTGDQQVTLTQQRGRQG